MLVLGMQGRCCRGCGGQSLERIASGPHGVRILSRPHSGPGLATLMELPLTLEELMDALDIHAALRRYWGYSEFRPMQEKIVQAILAGRDAAVVMPTGGGKSLCYQLPAALMDGTAIVVSPLIALMRDQVASLAANGLRSAFLNSSLTPTEQQRVMREAKKGVFHLLYLSPERLARQDTIEQLQQMNVSLFVIDEAHCISEWGHEFRPDYRQLGALKRYFPAVPIAAFTASATQRVRHDILQQLHLQEPAKFIVSFHRPNLRYIAKEVDDREQQRLMLAAIRANEGESVIIYAPTVNRVHETVDLLRAKRIDAVPYHGQMDNKHREQNQERWMEDEVRVVVATLAFGLGINKPGVRAVVHLALPKSLEQYYQEAGRAGRDGEPADCLLLWRKRDAGLLKHFIDQLEDHHEKQMAWARYREIRGFVESGECRHRTICRHFGETPKWTECGMCDVCRNLPEWMDATAEATVHRRLPKSAAPKKLSAADTAVVTKAADPLLHEHLRQWRRHKAAELQHPAYLIFSDVTLEDLARKRPRNRAELLGVTGIGQRKAERFGEEILFEIQRQQADAPSPIAPIAAPHQDLLVLLEQGRTLPEVAALTGTSVLAVVNRVCDLVAKGELRFRDEWIPLDHQQLIRDAVARVGGTRLKALKEILPPEVSYEEIRLMLVQLRRGAAPPAL